MGGHRNQRLNRLSDQLIQLEDFFFGSEPHAEQALPDVKSDELEQMLRQFEGLQKSNVSSEQARVMLLLSLVAQFPASHEQIPDELLSLEWARKALECAHKAGDPLCVARALERIGAGHLVLEDWGRAREAFLEAWYGAKSCHDLTCQWNCLRGLFLLYEKLHNEKGAQEMLSEALVLAEEGGHATLQVTALYLLAEYYYAREPRTALRWAMKAKDLADKLVLTSLSCKSRAILSRIYLELGELDHSKSWLENARTLTNDWHISNQSTVTWNMLGCIEELAGLIYYSEGDLEKSESCFILSLEIYKDTGGIEKTEGVYDTLVEISERRENFEKALEYTKHRTNIQDQLYKIRADRESKRLTLQIREETLKKLSEDESKRMAELEAANIALKNTQTELKRREIHDDLTGLVNRGYFQKRVHKLLSLVGPEDHLALLYIDVDHLKTINEKAGYYAGDAVLKEVAKRLQSVVRSGDLVARWDGDEFMLLLGHLAASEDIHLVAQKILQVLRQPFCLEDFDEPQQLSVSLGGVVAPEDGQTLELLDQHVNLALQQAKNKGRNTFQRFQAYMSVAEQERRMIESELRFAIERKQLSLHYQGQYRLPQRKLIGFEALVRWSHPTLGMVSPARFIPLAEETGLILEVDRWVLYEACRQAAEWGLETCGLTVAVNVSAKQFGQSDFVQQVHQALQKYKLSGKCLVLEVTESMVHHDPELAQHNIKALQDLGISIAMDDFGIGYSSLSMLQNLPFQYLKIDRSFLMNLSDGYAKAKLFMEVMVKLAHNLSMRVVAEGVEVEEHVKLLCELGYDTAQGYYMARPVAAEYVLEMLSDMSSEISSEVSSEA